MFDRSLARFGGRGQGSSLRHSVTTGDVDDGFRESRRRRLLLIRHRSMRLAGQDAQRYRPARHRSGFFLYNPSQDNSLLKFSECLNSSSALISQAVFSYSKNALLIILPLVTHFTFSPDPFDVFLKRGINYCFRRSDLYAKGFGRDLF